MKLDIKTIILLSTTFKIINNCILENKELLYNKLVERDFNITNKYKFTWYELYKFCYNLNLTSICRITSNIDDNKIQRYSIFLEDDGNDINGSGKIKMEENEFLESDIDFIMMANIKKNDCLAISGINYFSLGNILIGMAKFKGYIDISIYNPFEKKIIFKCDYFYQPHPEYEAIDNYNLLGKSTGICYLI